VKDKNCQQPFSCLFFFLFFSLSPPRSDFFLVSFWLVPCSSTRVCRKHTPTRSFPHKTKLLPFFSPSLPPLSFAQVKVYSKLTYLPITHTSTHLPALRQRNYPSQHSQQNVYVRVCAILLSLSPHDPPHPSIHPPTHHAQVPTPVHRSISDPQFWNRA